MPRGSRPTLTERRAEELRLTIARVARDMFIADGDTNATVERICAEVGIATRTFHRHFPIKEDVLGPLFRRSEDYMRGVLERAAPDSDPVDVLVDMFTSEVAGRQSTDVDRKFMELIAETPQYRLRWMQWGENLTEAITDLLSDHVDLGDDSFTRTLPGRLVVHVSRSAYMWWADAKESHGLDELIEVHRRGITLIVSSLPGLRAVSG
jgi:AcrR family transcriptional regulator